ncbi:MAG TPA: SPFH domain-containing protein [Gemmatimonadales bacterium]|nr:SPFH domain-containing protein [Gemmatimonadales bacterium]
MGRLVLGIILAFVALIVLATAKGVGGSGPRPGAAIMRLVGLALIGVALFFVLTSTVVIITPGSVGVRHAFGKVDPRPLLPGVNLVAPWSEVERYSAREEQWPPAGTEAEQIAALSSEQMGMTVDVAVRWQIDPQQAPRIFTEIGGHEQIANVVVNAVRNGARDGMVQFSINDISERNKIANAMQAEVDSALITQPREGGPPFRIAQLTAFFLRDLQPPAQVITAINNKIAQEQQVETERHRVEVARLQAEQQRLLNQTLTPEALTKQYLEVLHDMKGSSNLVLIVPTEGGMPMLNLGEMRKNLQKP